MVVVAELILASGSPYRKQLLESTGIVFETVVSGIDEEKIEAPLPEDTARQRAMAKAEEVGKRRPHSLVIGCDQVLDFKGKSLSKATNIEQTRIHLRELAGHTHTLHSAYCLYYHGASKRQRVLQSELESERNKQGSEARSGSDELESERNKQGSEARSGSDELESERNKPEERSDERSEERLQGANHEPFLDITSVPAVMHMRSLTDDEIEGYIERGHWSQVVGCYRYEGMGVNLFATVDGSQHTIVGLPLPSLLAKLRELGINPLVNPAPPWEITL